MRCFYHPQAEAVGVCKNCMRGLCTGCAADVGNGLACRERCEAQVAMRNDIIARASTANRGAQQYYVRLALCLALLVVATVVFGFLTTVVLTDGGDGFLMIFVAIGVLGLAAAGFTYAMGRSFRSPTSS